MCRDTDSFDQMKQIALNFASDEVYWWSNSRFLPNIFMNAPASQVTRSSIFATFNRDFVDVRTASLYGDISADSWAIYFKLNKITVDISTVRFIRQKMTDKRPMKTCSHLTFWRTNFIPINAESNNMRLYFSACEVDFCSPAKIHLCSCLPAEIQLFHDEPAILGTSADPHCRSSLCTFYWILTPIIF